MMNELVYATVTDDVDVVIHYKEHIPDYVLRFLEKIQDELAQVNAALDLEHNEDLEIVRETLEDVLNKFHESINRRTA